MPHEAWLQEKMYQEPEPVKPVGAYLVTTGETLNNHLYWITITTKTSGPYLIDYATPNFKKQIC